MVRMYHIMGHNMCRFDVQYLKKFESIFSMIMQSKLIIDCRFVGKSEAYMIKKYQPFLVSKFFLEEFKSTMVIMRGAVIKENKLEIDQAPSVSQVFQGRLLNGIKSKNTKW